MPGACIIADIDAVFTEQNFVTTVVIHNLQVASSITIVALKVVALCWGENKDLLSISYTSAMVSMKYIPFLRFTTINRLLYVCNPIQYMWWLKAIANTCQMALIEGGIEKRVLPSSTNIASYSIIVLLCYLMP